ncbi:MAG: hypothetical protein MRZ79_19340 [Bacteroidia bacterium]|nr:hypothetical protein [Bacteroidia bacterium]
MKFLIQKLTYSLLLLWGIALLSSCSSGELFVEKSIRHPKESSKITKVVSIDPQFEVIDQREEAEERYLAAANREDQFNEILKENAKMNEVELQIIDSDNLSSSDLVYFNELMPLRKQIWNANWFQDVAVMGVTYGSNYVPNTGEFRRGLVMDAQFSNLSKAYNTPYFALNGVIASVVKRKGLGTILGKPKSKMLYYFILVNVESSEVLYREVRSLNKPASKLNLHSITYDSFRILRK